MILDLIQINLVRIGFVVFLLDTKLNISDYMYINKSLDLNLYKGYQLCQLNPYLKPEPVLWWWSVSKDLWRKTIRNISKIKHEAFLN